MPKVLIVGSDDLTPQLGRTILWRSGIERVFAQNRDAAVAAACSLRPRLVVVDGTDARSAATLLRDLRGNPETRESSVAVISRAASLDQAEEETLRRAGANVVLAGPVDVSLWDWRLESLLSVPRRRRLRIPVRFVVWSQAEPPAPPAKGLVLNISLRGLLLESERSIDAGTRVHLAIAVPEDAPLQAEGRVVWGTGTPGRRFHSGVKLLNLREDVRERLRGFIEGETGH